MHSSPFQCLIQPLTHSHPSTPRKALPRRALVLPHALTHHHYMLPPPTHPPLRCCKPIVSTPFPPPSCALTHRDQVLHAWQLHVSRVHRIHQRQHLTRQRPLLLLAPPWPPGRGGSARWWRVAAGGNRCCGRAGAWGLLQLVAHLLRGVEHPLQLPGAGSRPVATARALAHA